MNNLEIAYWRGFTKAAADVGWFNPNHPRFQKGKEDRVKRKDWEKKNPGKTLALAAGGGAILGGGLSLLHQLTKPT